MLCGPGCLCEGYCLFVYYASNGHRRFKRPLLALDLLSSYLLSTIDYIKLIFYLWYYVIYVSSFNVCSCTQRLRFRVLRERPACKGLATLCVLSAQSRTRSAEIAFLRSLKIVQLIGNTRAEPHYDSTQKRNIGRTRPRLRTLYA